MLCVFPNNFPCSTGFVSFFEYGGLFFSVQILIIFCINTYGRNADADRNNARLCCDNEDLEMRAIKPIAKGEEILNDYGQLPRSDLLRRYGYVTANYGQYDVAEISTQDLLSMFCSREALQGLDVTPLSQEEIASRVSHFCRARGLLWNSSSSSSVLQLPFSTLYRSGLTQIRLS